MCKYTKINNTNMSTDEVEKDYQGKISIIAWNKRLDAQAFIGDNSLLI